MTTIKAIETRYKGYRFRSRLEARWAVFFDALGVKWEYEPQGFDLNTEGWYLPDFWLPDQRYWFECKPIKPPKCDIKKYVLLANGTNAHVVIATGAPGIEPIYDRDGSIWARAGNLCWVWPRENIDDDDFFSTLQWIYSPRLDFRVGAFLGECIDTWQDDDAERGGEQPYHRAILAAYNAARGARFEHGESGYPHG